MHSILSTSTNSFRERWMHEVSTVMKRLIKTRIKIEPFKIYEFEDHFVAELNDVEVFRPKHQHLCTSYCMIEIQKQRNLKNELIMKNIQELKAQGII